MTLYEEYMKRKNINVRSVSFENYVNIFFIDKKGKRKILNGYWESDSYRPGHYIFREKYLKNDKSRSYLCENDSRNIQYNDYEKHIVSYVLNNKIIYKESDLLLFTFNIFLISYSKLLMRHIPLTHYYKFFHVFNDNISEHYKNQIYYLYENYVNYKLNEDYRNIYNNEYVCLIKNYSKWVGNLDKYLKGK